MKRLTTYLPLLFLIVQFLFLSGNANAASHYVSRQKVVFSSQLPDVGADLITDDDALVAEDDDGDDFSESLNKFVPASFSTFILSGFNADQHAVFIPYRTFTGPKTSPSFLRVFRI